MYGVVFEQFTVRVLVWSTLAAIADIVPKSIAVAETTEQVAEMVMLRFSVPVAVAAWAAGIATSQDSLQELQT